MEQPTKGSNLPQLTDEVALVSASLLALLLGYTIELGSKEVLCTKSCFIDSFWRVQEPIASSPFGDSSFEQVYLPFRV
eukprot:5941810-Amphidinium_carterae.1